MDRMDSIYFTFKIWVIINLINFSFEAYAWNEFSGYNYVPDPIGVLGFTIGKNSTHNKKGMWNCIAILAGLFLGFRVIAFIFLWSLKSKL